VTWTASNLPSHRPALLEIATLAAVGILVGTAFLGWTLAAPSVFQKGVTEQGQGTDVGEGGPAYWVWEAAQLWGMPTPVPALASSTALTPTLLPAISSSFRINAATAGNTSVRWEFKETTAAPGTTELELRFTDGLTRPAVSLTVYLETRPGVLPGALTFFVFWDAGAFGPARVTVETMQVNVLVCAPVGVCP
jgi:hypothetical protein